MSFIFAVLAIIAGATMSTQAGINAQLQHHWAQNAILAATVSFLVGSAGLVLYIVIARVPIPALNGKTEAWHWLGGLLGAYFVAVMTYLAPRLGASALVALVIAGQVGTSLILDQFGLLGYAQKSLTWQRVAGATLLGAGVFLIRRY